MVYTVHCPGGDFAAGDAGLLRAVMAAAAGDPSQFFPSGVGRPGGWGVTEHPTLLSCAIYIART